MTDTDTSTFSQQLRRLRRAADITQEELAERAGLSPRAISDLERGVKTRPHQITVDLLADGLALSTAERAALHATVNRRRGALPEREPLRPPAQLPEEPTPLIGRERDEAIAVHLLRQRRSRLLTLTGPGGVGKTRLAIRIAATVASDFSDGVAFVPVAAVADPALLLSTIARAIGVREVAERPLIETLQSKLRGRRLLVVLDNFEHLISQATLVAELHASLPDVTMLITSREPLRVRAEQEMPVAPLEAPDHTRVLTPEELVLYPATALFVERAHSIRPELTISLEDSQAIGQICAHLDGLPLAIELASAHIRFMSPSALRDRLGNRLQMLDLGSRDLPLRQQTMRDTIAWSYDLLDERQQHVFRHVCVFSGSFTLDAAAQVCCGAPDPLFAGALYVLASKSLVAVSDQRSVPRFSLLATIREYGLELLGAAGEEHGARILHAEHMSQLVTLAEPELRGARQAEWLTLLDLEHDDIRAALRFLLASRQADAAMQLGNRISSYWFIRGHITEGREWHASTEELRSTVSARTRGSSLNFAARFALAQGHNDLALQYFDVALLAYREAEHRRGEADVLTNLGMMAHHAGDYARAHTLYTQNLALRRELEDEWGIRITLNNLGLVLYRQDQPARAREMFEEALVLSRERGDTQVVATILANMALVSRNERELAVAIASLEEAVELQRNLADMWGLATSLTDLGGVLLDIGDVERARVMYLEVLELCRTQTRKDGMAFALEGLGRVAARQDDPATAVRLLASADAIRTALSQPLPQSELEVHEREVESLRRRLGEATFSSAWQSGSSMDAESAVEYVTESMVGVPVRDF